MLTVMLKWRSCMAWRSARTGFCDETVLKADAGWSGNGTGSTRPEELGPVVSFPTVSPLGTIVPERREYRVWWMAKAGYAS